MIQTLHISAECYPAAKTGGLGDVVGSIPKYMTNAGVLTAAVIPKYSLKWINGRDWVTVYHGAVRSDWRTIHFSVQQERDSILGFPFFVVDIPGLFDRPGIYSDPNGWPYGDEVERYLVFQQAVLQWLISFPEADRPRVLHCHDHHTGLIPFLVKYSPDYQALAGIPTVFTIHNGQYQGAFSWRNHNLLPFYYAGARGFMEWNGAVNPMASAVKCAWAVTTVSESYLFELHQNSMGLEPLFRSEWHKEHGIINGIDVQVWDPRTDKSLAAQLEGDRPEQVAEFKRRNKKVLCEWFGLPEDQPLISYIGRMVQEKGSDLLPDAYEQYIQAGGSGSFLVLGTGESWTENQFRHLAWQYQGRVAAVIDYNEALAHQIYAGSDFLIMPSRVEPCGLNQMYAMRYGAIPIVRSIGGLKDTVPDIAEPDGRGRGIRFDQFSLSDIGYAIHRGASMWHNEPGIVALLRSRIMAVDYSWEHAIKQYFHVYRSIGARIEPVVAKPVAVQQVETKVAETPKVEPKVVKAPKAAAKKQTAVENKPEPKAVKTHKATAKKQTPVESKPAPKAAAKKKAEPSKKKAG